MVACCCDSGSEELEKVTLLEDVLEELSGSRGVGALGSMTRLLAAMTDCCCAPRGAARVKPAKITVAARSDADCFDTMIGYLLTIFP